LRMGV